MSLPGSWLKRTRLINFFDDGWRKLARRLKTNDTNNEFDDFDVTITSLLEIKSACTIWCSNEFFKSAKNLIQNKTAVVWIREVIFFEFSLLAESSNFRVGIFIFTSQSKGLVFFSLNMQIIFTK